MSLRNVADVSTKNQPGLYQQPVGRDEFKCQHSRHLMIDIAPEVICRPKQSQYHLEVFLG